MSVFRIFVDGQLFYHPHLSQLSITEAKVQEDSENIDSLTLSAPFNHPYLSAIQPMASTIVCKKDDLTVFEGRALDDGADFYNTHTWTCESCLAYLKDTMQPPFSYQGPLRGLLEQFLSVHNAAVEEKKQFTLGTVTVTDNNDYISYSNSDYSVTMDAIQDKLVKTHGGYLQVRYTEDGKVLDYLEDFPDRSLQTVEFGKNLNDVKITRDHTERVTALIPLGAKLTETDEDGNENETDTRLDITAVNDGRNYVYDEEAVKEIGWIWTTEVWEDVTLAGNLLRKAKSRIAELAKGVTSMELTIVDESDTGADIGDIRARMYVRCISKPHGIDGTYLCLSRTRDYLDPSGNTITIGAAGVRLTSQSAKQEQNITSIEDDLLGQTSKIEVITGKVDQINAQKMYRTELVVDGVNIFRDKGQRSILRCRVYSWDKEITDTLPASSFVWHAIVFSVYAPEGTVVINQSGSLVLAAVGYDGASEITTGATYQWARYIGGEWENITGETSSTLSVSGADIVNIQSYRCTMTYKGNTYEDVITVEDKSDPYVSEMLSIGGFTVKNNLGGVVPYVIVRTNQKEVDPLLGSISETAPSNPEEGDFWYQVDHSAQTVTLMKYSGSAWAAATEKQSLTYTWYAQDKDGHAAEFDKAGKAIYLSAADIDSILTLQCDVSN